MVGLFYYYHSLRRPDPVIDPLGGLRIDYVILLSVEYEYRYVDTVSLEHTLALFHVKSVSDGYAALDPAKEERDIDLVSSLAHIEQRSREPVIRAVCDDACDALREIRLLCRDKSARRTHAATEYKYSYIFSHLALAELDPGIEVDALAKSVRAVVTAAHAVRTLMYDEYMALDLCHDELSVCRYHRRMFIITVEQYEDVPAGPVKRRSVVTCELNSVKSSHPYVDELHPVRVKPVPTLADNVRSVDLRRRPVDRRHWFRTMEDSIKEPVSERDIDEHCTACQDQEQYYGHDYIDR